MGGLASPSRSSCSRRAVDTSALTSLGSRNRTSARAARRRLPRWIVARLTPGTRRAASRRKTVAAPRSSTARTSASELLSGSRMAQARGESQHDQPETEEGDDDGTDPNPDVVQRTRGQLAGEARAPRRGGPADADPDDVDQDEYGGTCDDQGDQRGGYPAGGPRSAPADDATTGLLGTRRVSGRLPGRAAWAASSVPGCSVRTGGSR